MGVLYQYSSVGVYDAKRDLLYFIKTVGESNHLHSIKLTSWTQTQLHLDLTNIYAEAESLILLDNELHIFGYAQDYRPFHSAINVVTWEVAEADISGCPFQFECSRVVMYEDAKTRFILEYKGWLVQYRLQDKQFNVLEWTKSVQPRFNSGIVHTLDKRYILRFGGNDISDLDGLSGDGVFNNIVVFDMKTESVTKCDLKCPVPAAFDAILLGSELRNELTVFGVVREIFAASEFKDVQKLPVHIIQMTCNWFSNEWIHLVASNKERSNKGHWRVNVDEFLSGE